MHCCHLLRVVSSTNWFYVGVRLGLGLGLGLALGLGLEGLELGLGPRFGLELGLEGLGLGLGLGPRLANVTLIHIYPYSRRFPQHSSIYLFTHPYFHLSV
jgi:hypothetical protein